MRFKRMLTITAMLFALTLLTGCVLKSADELYAVPKRSDEYNSLQTAVEAAMGINGTYCAPVTGSNQQAIQQADLDGDGINEAIVYAKIDGEKPLKAFVFKRDEENQFSLRNTIEGDGTSFDNVQYVQLDGEPGMELVLGRQVSENVLQSLSVYSFKNNTLTELAATNYSFFTTVDLDSNSLTDIFVLRDESEQRTATAELYRWKDGELARETEARLSTSAESVKRILTGNMSTDTRGVFVASTYDESSIITDVFAIVNGTFCNVSQSAESGISNQNVRNYYVYSTDLDNDGLLELPNTIALNRISGDASSENQYKVVWYNLNPDGSRTEKAVTYHNYSEGWYLRLDPQWSDLLSVTKKSLGETAGTSLYKLDNGLLVELLTVYAFSGEDAQVMAQADGRVLLAEKGGVYYSAAEGQITDAQTLQQMFHFISTDAVNNDG